MYQQFIDDSSGNTTATDTFDSCYVIKDTLIHGSTYFKYYRPIPFNDPYHSPYIFERDSSGYVVTPWGNILFAADDFQTVFDSHYNVIPGSEDTLYHAIIKMEDKDKPITVPAGTFVTSDYRTTFYMYPIWSMSGSIRTMHSRYAENIGLIEETLPIYAGTPTYVVRRLVRYHIN